jgi:hypothetical protein
LRACIRQGDTLARQGGDEFILVLPDISDPAIAGRVAEHLLQALREPFALQRASAARQRQHRHQHLSAGCADPTDADPFRRQRHVSGQGSRPRRYAFFTSELNVQVSELFTLSNDLRRALERRSSCCTTSRRSISTGRQLIGAEA